MAAFIGSDNLIELGGLKSAITNNFVNNAQVEVTILDPAGAELGGASWPLVMSYVADSDGLYRAILSHALPFVAKQQYTALISADAGVGALGTWQVKFKPSVR